MIVPNAIHIMRVKPMIQMRILLSKEKKTKREEFTKRRKIRYNIIWKMLAATSFPITGTNHHKRRLPKINWALQREFPQLPQLAVGNLTKNCEVKSLQNIKENIKSSFRQKKEHKQDHRRGSKLKQYWRTSVKY